MKHFDSLSLDERMGIVEKGTFAEMINYFNFNIYLHVLPYGEFAEVWYSIKLKEVTDVRIIETDDELLKWLNRINLNLDL